MNYSTLTKEKSSFLGVGVAWVDQKEYINFIENELDPCQSYIEVHLPTSIKNIPKQFIKIAHCSTLPLADIHQPSRTLIEDVFQQAQAIDAQWIGEHLSILGTTSGVQFGYIFAPPHEKGLQERIVKRIQQYREEFGIPFVIELGPRYTAWGGKDVIEDYRLLRNISVEANVPIILDIPHTVATANAFNISYEEILDYLDGAKVCEIHIGADGVSKKRNVPFEERWQQLVTCVKRFSGIRGITVELGKNTQLVDYCNTVRNVMERLPELNLYLKEATHD
ncbi:hypothetical protein BAU26_25865 [Bacillus sp. N35-10-4]|uniref:multinuclear nonheme iron-dependent oxidase n=1 Tax=Bacillus sp. N35-10-4 TaxID=1866315 RepID=UPI0008FDC5E3|nr:DUF692 family multinuclear iron-containing protein [Bacillus sp. N35-10-4]OJD55689.1 hypothetical protein BAU26_25865 [Bacillus sp. N35-10-4]